MAQTTSANDSAAVPLGAVVGMEPGQGAPSALADGLRALYARGELCDMAFVACGERFPAHKAMLAAMSSNFRDYLRKLYPQGPDAEVGEEDPMAGLLAVAPGGKQVAAAGGAGAAEQPAAGPEAAKAEGERSPQGPAGDAAEPICVGEAAAAAAAGEPAAVAPSAQPRYLELEVVGVSTAEAVRILLSYMYSVGTCGPWEYEASSPEVNKDILRLSRHFCLQHLHEHAARWLAKGLTTSNVVERLVTCEEFGLGLLREKIIEKLTANPAELMIVSRSEEITKHPRILQDLLLQVAMICGMGGRGGAGAAPAAQPAPGGSGEQPDSAAAAAAAEKEEKEKAAQEKEREKAAAQKGQQKVQPPAKRGRKGAAGA